MPDLSNKPLLTFAIGAYNQEKFIREAVESAFAQTYSPLEIILSDDCSPDRTFEIMSEMAKEYRGPHKIVLNRNPSNFGLGKHINRIWELVHGEFLVVEAGDDISLPNRTEVMFNAWEHSGRKTRVIQCRTIDIDEEGGLLGGPEDAADSGEIKFTEQRPALESYLSTLRPGILGCALGYDPELFRIFGPLPDGLIHEDNVIALRAMIFGPMLFVSARLLRRRIHGNNIYSHVHERVATRDAVARQEARVTRDARNRVILYEAMLSDLATAKKKGLIKEEECPALERECLRQKRLFSCQMNYAGASLIGKIQLFLAARRDKADRVLLKWMALRLPPTSMFQWTKTRVNSVRLAVSARLAPGGKKQWTS
jgi:glycosyltransferase involved in cell wall biosynthesis